MKRGVLMKVPNPPKPPERGRPKLNNREMAAEVLRLYLLERMSLRKVAKVLGVSHMTVYRVLNTSNIELLLN